MINASTLNYVRQKADDGKRWAELHEQLKQLNAMDFDGKKKELAKLDADRKDAEDRLRGIQETIVTRRAQLERAVNDVSAAKTEADSIIDRAQKRADEIVSEGAKVRADHLTDWDKSINDKRSELRAVLEELTHRESERDAVVDNLRGLQKQHDELTRKHEQLRAGLAALTKDI